MFLAPDPLFEEYVKMNILSVCPSKKKNDSKLKTERLQVWNESTEWVPEGSLLTRHPEKQEKTDLGYTSSWLYSG